MKPLYFVPFCSLALIASVVGVEACSSSSSDGAGAQAGQDASTGADGDGGSGPGSSLVACGPPPYITLGLVVEQASTGATAPRIGGAVLTSPLCPDASFTSDGDGGIVGLVTKGVPFYGQFNAAGYAPTLSPEENFEVDTSEVAIALPPSLLAVIVPNYDTSKTLIFVGVRKDTGTKHDGGADCTDVSGVSVAVTGHPEAAVTYYTADAVPAPVPGGTATTTGGAVSITGVDVSAGPVTVTAAKPGCTVTLMDGAATGRLPLENGYVSIAAAYLRN